MKRVANNFSQMVDNLQSNQLQSNQIESGERLRIAINNAGIAQNKLLQQMAAQTIQVKRPTEELTELVNLYPVSCSSLSRLFDENVDILHT